MKVWQDGKVELNGMIESYTVGKDRELDHQLLTYDIYGTAAHGAMLREIGILTDDEFLSLKKALNRMLGKVTRGEFGLAPGDEDVHSCIERHLTLELGDVGKKVHTGRSRNDQVIVDIRLYARDRLLELKGELLSLCLEFLEFAEGNRVVPMPGYTHMRRAMPSSVGLWAGSIVESLLDDLIYIDAAYEHNHMNPLGSAAGYGVPLPLDRELTTSLLGFRKTQNNVLYVQNSRGKLELGIIDALKQVMLDLNRFATDVILFSMDEFGFFTVPPELCTGSSIMPQKKNPDVLELMRANYYEILSCSNKVAGIVGSLPSGYNRDVQLTKEPLMVALELTISTVSVCRLVVSGMEVNPGDMESALVPSLFAADGALEQTLLGKPFREAYMEFKDDSRWSRTSEDIFRGKDYPGAPGNPGLEAIGRDINEQRARVCRERERVRDTFDRLMGI